MHSNYRFALALVASLTPSLAAQDAATATEAHLLRHTFKEGATAHFSVTNNASMLMEAGGQEMEMTTVMQTFYTLNVVSVGEDGNARVEQTCFRVKGSFEHPMMGSLAFDSDDEESDAGPMEQMLDLVGSKMSATIDPRGQTSDVEVPGFVENLGAGDVSQTLARLFPTFPEEPIEIGATWKVDSEQRMGQMGAVSMQTTNKLTAVDGNAITIEQQIAGSTDAESEFQMTTNKGVGTIQLERFELLPTVAEAELELEFDSMMAGGQVHTKVSVAACEPPAAKEAESTGEEKPATDAGNTPDKTGGGDDR